MRFLVLPALLLASGCGGVEGPNVVIITLDTTRRDHLGCYGYERETSPHLDALAAESTVFENAYAVSSWTLPTHASLFTGRFPQSHGARYDPKGSVVTTPPVRENPDEVNVGDFRVRKLSYTEKPLAKILKDTGYRTFGCASGPWLKGSFGLGFGFEEYVDDVDQLTGRLAHDVTDRAITFLDQVGDTPFFLFLNYFDPHQPWGAPGADRTRFIDRKVLEESVETIPDDKMDQLARGVGRTDSIEVMKALYDGEIFYMDRHIGRLFDELKQRGEWDNTWIIVTSDHGELLGENGRFGHGVDSLSEAEIHIPLIIKPPGEGSRTGLERGRDARFVQQVDVLPILLTELGIPMPRGVQGRLPGDPHPILAELWPAREGMNKLNALVEGKDKILRRNDDVHLYDIAADPDESKDLAPEQAARAGELDAALRAFLERLPVPKGGDLPSNVLDVPEETLEALRNLGYAGG